MVKARRGRLGVGGKLSFGRAPLAPTLPVLFRNQADRARYEPSKGLAVLEENNDKINNRAASLSKKSRDCSNLEQDFRAGASASQSHRQLASFICRLCVSSYSSSVQASALWLPCVRPYVPAGLFEFFSLAPKQSN